ncbi:MAG: HAMP domain-containing sensor histidine kinase [Eubacteriales bacterium]|nr:HAMP domain-containing sensor histidine kinase [Eubacteriales bacterium]
MKKLKRSIVCCFVGTTISLTIGELVLALLLREALTSYYGISGTVAVAAGTLVVNIVMGAALIMVGPAAWLFSRAITKKINAEIQRQTDERNMLYANIAHDLKTPMTSILGYAKALGDKKVELEQAEIVIDRIYQKARQTDELLNMLFEYTKLQAESYPLNKMEADICRVVRSVAAGQYEAFEEKNIRLEIDIPDEKILVSCDVLQMTRAVSNLIINAYKHNAEGSRVGIKVRKEENGVWIIVADTGMDIRKEESEIIFEPFVSGDASRNASYGSGLGLAIARKIVEKHGGTLTVEHREVSYVKEFVICLRPV